MKSRRWIAALALSACMAVGTAQAQTYFQVWPYLPDGGGWETFIRHTTGTNPSTLSLILVNERGVPSRYVLRVDAGEVRHVNSSTLRRAGVTAGPWWAWATWTGSAPPPRPFLRTSDGFVVPLGLVMEGIPSSLVRNVANTDSRLRGMQWGIRGLTLNPGRNTNQVGVVQIANLSPTQDSRIAFVLSDDGEGFAIGTSNLPAGNARRFQSTEIERIAGAQPQGKWRVSVLSTQLLEGQTAIWSRPTALYAPTGDQTPETVPTTTGGSAAQAAGGGTDAPTGVAEAWDRMAQELAAHLAQDAAQAASDTAGAEPPEPVDRLEAIRALFGPD